MKAAVYSYSFVYPVLLESRVPCTQVSEEVNIPIQLSRCANSHLLNVLANAPKLYLKDTVNYCITWPYTFTLSTLEEARF